MICLLLSLSLPPLHTIDATDDATLEAQASQAWQIFDQVNAISLSPSPSRVEYVGPYDGHTLLEGEIAVWNAAGATYLFTSVAIQK